MQTPPASLCRRILTGALVAFAAFWAPAAETPGSTDGNFAVGADGAATYSIPIVVPPGTAGVQPKLRLAYSSRGGPGAVGFGWIVGGLSAIQRGPRNLTDDGVVRGVWLDDGDALYLDGGKLVQVAHDQAHDMREFRQQVDGLSRIRGYGWTSAGAERFVVNTRAGLKMFYGSTEQSKVRTSGGRVLIWLCDRLEDNVGNYIQFTYGLNGLDYRIARIDYTGNDNAHLAPYAQVTFDYEEIEPYEYRYVLGDKVEPKHQLTRIQSFFQSKLLRRYDLVHQKADSYRKPNYLTEVHESGADGLGYRPLRFTYSASKSNWQKQTRLNIPVDFSKLTGIYAGFRFLDLNADGRIDLIYRAGLSGSVNSDAYVNNSSAGWVRNAQWSPPVDLAGDQGANRGVVLRDVTGDGRADLVVSSDRDGSRVHVLASNQWQTVEAPAPFRFVRAGAPDNGYLFLDIDPAAKNGEELLFSSAAQGTGAAHFDGTRWTNLAGFAPPLPFQTDSDGNLLGVYAADVDCDGKKELVYLQRNGSGAVVSAVYKADTNKWVEVTDKAFRLPFDPVPNAAAIRFVDLNADGYQDVIYAYESGGRRYRGAYLASAAGWKADTRPLPDFVLWIDTGSEAVAEVADIDGDKRADILWNSARVTPQRNAYYGTSSGWRQDLSAAPPTALPPSFTDRGLMFQVLDLNHDAHPRLVYLARGAPPAVYNLTAGAWTADVSFNVPMRVAQFDRVDLGVRFLDLDGDGRADVAYSKRNSNGGLERAAYIFKPAQANPWVEDIRFHYPVPTFTDDLRDLGTALVDFNGDGLTDIIVGYDTGTTQLAAYENCSQKPECQSLTGEGAFWRPVAGMAPPEPLAKFGVGSYGVKFADLNGDGLTDMLVSRQDALTFPYPLYSAAYLNTGTGWVLSKDFKSPVEFVRPYLTGLEEPPPYTTMRDLSVQLIDLNGDRLPDLVYHFTILDPTIGFTPKKGAYLNTGSGWKEWKDYAPPKKLDPDDASPYRQVYFQDVNGDGLPDLIYAEKEGTTSRSETYLNTARGWAREPLYDLPPGAVYASKGDQGFRFMDVNGDGLVDIAYHWIAPGNTEVAGSFLNSGHGWQSATGEDFVPPVPFTEDGRGDLGVRPMDLNGDTLVDLAQSYLRDYNDDRQAVYLNLSGPPDLMTGIETGLGAHTTLTYQSVLGLDPGTLAPLPIYRPPPARTAAYPVVDSPLPGFVVTKVVSEANAVEPRASTYRYGEYRVDIRSGHPLGFAFQEVRDEARRRTSQMLYLQAEGLVGTTSNTDVLQDAAHPVRISTAAADWATAVTHGEPVSNGFQPPVYRAYLKSHRMQSWDLAGTLLATKLDSYEYDALGNPTRVRTDFDDGSASETVNTYADDTGAWLLARLVEAQVTLSAPSKSPEVRTARFRYDPGNGQLMEEVSLAGTKFATTTVYTRDVFGNKLSQTTSTLDGNPPRRTDFTYDPLGRFPLTSRNPLGHTSGTSYDDVSGVVVHRRAPNGVTLRMEYDSLQRLQTERSPTGVITRTSTVFPAAGAPDYVAFSVIKQTDGLPPARTDYDAAARVRTAMSVGDGGRGIVTSHEYDPLGRLVRSSLPRYDGDPVLYLEQSYDDLDRVVMERRPDGTYHKTDYAGLTTQVTDHTGRSIKTARDSRGRTLYTIDPAGGRTTFIYGLSGQVTGVRNALDQLTEVEYNLAGQRVRITEAAMGTWRYEFDSYGNLLLQTDGRGKKVAFKYDALGRVLERTSETGTARWSYDDPHKGIGQPARIETSAGDWTSFAYDDFGRLAVAESAVGRDHITFTQEYDEYGRPRLRRYSTGFAVDNYYDPNGFWTQVKIQDRQTKTVVWEALQHDAAGRVVRERLGNGIVSTHTYDAQTGRLTRSQSVDASMAALQDYSLEYDSGGNISARRDALTGGAETYLYDPLYRLTQANLPSGTVSVAYDALGNIASRSDTGAYQYCGGADNKARLCGITAPDGKSTALTYDEAGNVTRLGKTQITIDGMGRAGRIAQSWFNYSNFSYGADGEILRQETRHEANKFITVNLADTQVMREDFAPPLFPTPERTRVRHFLQSPTGTLGYYEFTYWHFAGHFVDPAYEEKAFPIPQRSTELTTGMNYFVKDHAGSIRLILDGGSKVTDRLSFDPWGRRTDHKGRYFYRAMTAGFTGHEHLDGLGLIHMGGRIYSPMLARFLSPDPQVQSAGYSQSYNRYAYVLNNPLRMIDPSGYSFLGDFFGAIGDFFSGVAHFVADAVDFIYGKPLRWIAEQLVKAGHWLVENWRTIAVIVVSVALTAVGIPPIFVGALAGGLNAALYGGSLEDIMQGVTIGAISGGCYTAVAQAASGPLFVAVNGGVHGLFSSVQGGKFWQGFVSSVAADVLSPLATIKPGTEYRVAAAAAVGGVVSQVSGGNFGNGAMTGAFSELFRIAGEGQTTRNLTDAEKQWARKALRLEHSQDEDWDASSLNFLDSVKVVTGHFMGLQTDDVAMTPDGRIYWPKSLGDTMDASKNQDVFTHELEHLYQYSRGENVLFKGALLQTAGLFKNVYKFDLNQPYSSYNIEQRGNFLKFLMFPNSMRVEGGVVMDPYKGHPAGVYP